MADVNGIKRTWNFKDLAGLRFGKWTVLSFCEMRNHASYWNCRCTCGRESVMHGRSLTSGNSKSCGCFRTDQNGMADSREYHAWWNARRRCTDPASRQYHSYGGRGITMCDRWLNSFSAFFEDMGQCPRGLTIDRIDNDGPYSPENCRWATQKQQTRNRRMTLMATHNGETLSLGEWSERTGIPYDRLEDRYEHGKDLFAPLHQGQGRRGRQHSG